MGLAVAQLGQLLVVLLSQRGVAALERFIGQTLVGQTGATGQADGQCQGTHCSNVGASLLAIQAARCIS
ncbi:hypothetical protein D3C84_980820 [compost metagenome]